MGFYKLVSNHGLYMHSHHVSRQLAAAICEVPISCIWCLDLRRKQYIYIYYIYCICYIFILHIMNILYYIYVIIKSQNGGPKGSWKNKNPQKIGSMCLIILPRFLIDINIHVGENGQWYPQYPWDLCVYLQVSFKQPKCTWCFMFHSFY